jgi:hypothetical protein
MADQAEAVAQTPLGRQALVLPAKEITAAQALRADQAKAAVAVARVAWA